MTQFANITAVVAYAKSGAKLSAIAQAVLQNNKAEGLALLQEETIKAALAAALWNNPAKISTVTMTVREGKKTALCKQWLKATTELVRSLPTNISGDVSRITDEGAFVEYVNAAIAAWEKDWADFESAQKLKAEQRASKSATPATATPATDTTADTAATDTAAVALANSAREVLELRTRVDALLTERQALLKERDALLKERDALLSELATLKAANSKPARKRAKKETAA